MTWLLDLFQRDRKHQLIAAIDEKIDELHSLEEYERDYKAAIKTELSELVLNGLRELSEDERREVAGELYWNNEVVSAKQVLEASGLSREELASTFQVRCRECESWFWHPISSRAQYQSLRAFIKKNGHYGLCPDCEAKQVQRYASRKAEEQSRIEQLKSMPYREFLETEFWQEVRKRKLKQARFKCQMCNISNNRLNVHHRTYEHHGEEDMYLGDLIVLCEHCHGKFHDKLP